MWGKKSNISEAQTAPEMPKFVIKVKQNRYEKFIIDELRVSGDSPEDLLLNLQTALTQAIEEIQGLNA